MAIKDGVAIGSFPVPQEAVGQDWRYGYHLVRQAIVGMLQGRVNAVGEISVEAGDSPLTVNDLRCSEDSVIVLMIGTQEFADNFTYWISDTSNGSFTLEFTYAGQLPTTTVRYLIQG